MTRRKRKIDPEHEQAYHDLPPAWPPYCPKPRERVLAVMLGDGSILAETGEKWLPETWDDMASLLFQENLLVFIGDVSHACQPWQNNILDELVGDKAGKLRGGWSEIGYNKNQQYLTSVKVHRKWPDSRGRMRWQVRTMEVSEAWGRTIEPELLTDLRYLFTLLETGVVATPGAAGYATMARFWKGKSLADMPKHFRPPLTVVELLENQAIGSRRESYRPTEVFTQAYELDRRCGFAAEAGELPMGPTIYFPGCVAHDELYHLEGEPRQETFTWWGKCIVKLLRDLQMGDVAPFAVRDPQTDELHWPTTAGSYTTYLWKHEADEIQRRFLADGDMVVLTICEAWAWVESTAQLAPWRAFMDAQRREAARHSKAAEALVKQVIVAAIGRLGLPYEYNEILAEPEEGAVPLEGAALFDEPLYLKTTFDDLGQPKHWQSWILSKMNMKLYEVLRWGYLNGIGMVSSNVDSVVFEKDPGWGAEPDQVAIGEFKRQSLGDYTACPYPGALLSPAKLTTPGMERKYRERLMRIGEYKPEDERRHRNKSAPRKAFSNSMQAMMNYKELDPKKIKKGEGKLYTLKEEIQQLEQLRRFMLKIAGTG